MSLAARITPGFTATLLAFGFFRLCNEFFGILRFHQRQHRSRYRYAQLIAGNRQNLISEPLLDTIDDCAAYACHLLTGYLHFIYNQATSRLISLTSEPLVSNIPNAWLAKQERLVNTPAYKKSKARPHWYCERAFNH